MAINWYVDEGLATLGTWWKKEHPGAVVYCVGDASHASRDSEHNPEPSGSEPGADYGEVDAADFMVGPKVTKADLRRLADDLVRSRDPRILYVIFDGKICSSRPVAGVPAWEWRTYTGKDKHTDHVHLSVNDKFDDNKSPWKLEDGMGRTLAWETATVKMPTMKYGDEDEQFTGYRRIKRAQLMLNYIDNSVPDLDADGVYGARTAQKLAAVMKGKPSSSTNGKILGLPEYRVLFGLS